MPRSRRACGSAPSCASRSWATSPPLAAARDHLAGDPSVAAAEIAGEGLLEIGFTGDDEAAARLLADAVAAGIRIASFARAASDLEELFLQVTGDTAAEVA